MARTITFQPNKNQSLFIEGLLESGGYSNQSEIIREGLRLLEEKYADSKLQQLRQLIHEGDESGVSQRSVWEIVQEAQKELDNGL